MKVKIPSIKNSLSMKISVGILLFVVAVFVVSLGFLFFRSRLLVKAEAIERAERALDNTVQRVKKCLDEAETATNNTAWLAEENLQADSLLNYTHRVVALNPLINGCSITMEPDVFTHGGRRFSAYSLRETDRIETVIEGDYDYYEKVWYKTAKERDEAVWVDPYNDFNEGTLSAYSMIASYCRPLRNANGDFIGVIATDIAAPQLSDIIDGQNPYEHSYGVLLGSQGNYFVHPDKMKLVKQSIFSVFEGEQRDDLIQLGHDMIDGKTGHVAIKLDKQNVLVFYRPVPGSSWSVGLVVPEDDIFIQYNRLGHIVFPLMIGGLLFLLLVCWKGVAHFIKPLNLLAKQAQYIANGHIDEHLPPSKRIDVVGHLQNNFFYIQRAIDRNINDIRQMNAATEERNQQLEEVNKQAQAAVLRKTNFLQNVSLQLRTPLNIIGGFMQVLRDSRDTLTDEDVKTQTDVIKEHTVTMRRMAHMIFDSSWMEDRPALDLTKEVNVNELARKVIQDFQNLSKNAFTPQFTTTLPDTKCIHTNPLYLFRVLRELIRNAKKYSSGEYIGLHIEQAGDMLRFTIEDKGPGITKEGLQLLFEPFYKSDSFTEGLGLGLSLARQTATLLNGTLEHDSSYKEGARFIMEIPDN